MVAIVCNASFSTCPSTANSFQHASVLTSFLRGVLNSQTEKLSGDLQNTEYLFMADFQFREEFLLLQLKCDLLLDSQDRAYSFRKSRNREDAAERLQKFVHWEVSFEATFPRRFAVLALIVHGLCPR
jgi:hypothetical protein